MPGLIKVDKYQPTPFDCALDSPEPRSSAHSRILSIIAASTTPNMDSEPMVSRRSLLSTTFKNVVPHCATNYDFAYTHSYLKQVAEVVHGKLQLPDNNDLEPNPTNGFYVSAVHRRLARAVMDCREVELEAWSAFIQEESAACLKVLGELDEDRMLRRCDRGGAKGTDMIMMQSGAHHKGNVLEVVAYGSRWAMEHLDLALLCYLIGLFHGAFLALLVTAS